VFARSPLQLRDACGNAFRGFRSETLLGHNCAGGKSGFEISQTRDAKLCIEFGHGFHPDTGDFHYLEERCRNGLLKFFERTVMSGRDHFLDRGRDSGANTGDLCEPPFLCQDRNRFVQMSNGIRGAAVRANPKRALARNFKKLTILLKRERNFLVRHVEGVATASNSSSSGPVALFSDLKTADGLSATTKTASPGCMISMALFTALRSVVV
jgi:hypothetical protein